MRCIVYWYALLCTQAINKRLTRQNLIKHQVVCCRVKTNMIVIKQRTRKKHNKTLPHTQNLTLCNEWYGYNSSLFSFEES